MIGHIERLQEWIDGMVGLLAQGESPDPQTYAYFMQEPELALRLVDLIDDLNEDKLAEQPSDEEEQYYSACVFVFDICVAQLQVAVENGYKLGEKTLAQLMSHLSKKVSAGRHTLSFWLPILNAFYEAHIELSNELKEAYMQLANTDEEQPILDDEHFYLDSMREMIRELSDLSIYEIAEHFFAQSHAMPPDFYEDLVIDLYNLEEGKEIALLTLLHPNPAIREVVVDTLDQLLDDLTLSSASLSRLQIIQKWYPPDYHPQFERWIKQQRKKGVVFQKPSHASIVSVHATEVDGTGAQGVFIHFKAHRQHRLCGLLLKATAGIKEAWITPALSTKEVDGYYHDALKASILLRPVDPTYLQIINHFLGVMIEKSDLPDLHFLAIQEALGLHSLPQVLNIKETLAQLAVDISPFTPARMASALSHSKTWPKTKRFTHSWYLENAQIDRIVNRCCSFIDGVKVCRFEEAMETVFTQEIERHREYWLFHFLWIALWLRSKPKKNEITGEDSFLIAYAIQSEDVPLNTIPIMQYICRHSVMHSIETMQERGTHLN